MKVVRNNYGLNERHLFRFDTIINSRTMQLFFDTMTA
jgi:hypothetical protein